MVCFAPEPNILDPWAPIWSTLGTHVDQRGAHGHKMSGSSLHISVFACQVWVGMDLYVARWCVRCIIVAFCFALFKPMLNLHFTLRYLCCALPDMLDSCSVLLNLYWALHSKRLF